MGTFDIQDLEDLMPALDNEIETWGAADCGENQDENDEWVERLRVLKQRVRDEHRSQIFERNVQQKFEPRVLELLGKLKTALDNAGFVMSEPWEMHDAEYRWYLDGYVDGHEGDDKWRFDLCFECPESEEYDGESFYGVNFGVNIVENGGSIIGGMSPYNYTDEVWVDARDTDALEARFKLIEDADIDECVKVIRDNYEGKE